MNFQAKKSKELREICERLKPVIEQRLKENTTLKTLAVDHGMNYNYLQRKVKEWGFHVSHKGGQVKQKHYTPYLRPQFPVLTEADIEQDIATMIFPHSAKVGISKCMPPYYNSAKWEKQRRDDIELF